ncbi:MAG: hypothetical protein IKO48_06740, partial [Elusimicrobia bacterium]|nr:hypothetical protein [Elusimicrobiota bacterium]
KKPTLILSVPYVIATIAPFVFALYPVAAVIISVTLATLTAQFLHYKYNKNQQDPGKLLKIEVEKNYFENAREYLKTKSIAETVKSKIQRVCAKNKIDLSNDKFFQELLFDYRLCFSEEPSLEYLLEIKIDGKNSELKKKVLNRYLDEIGYSIPQSGERKIYLLKELINSDDEIILNYLLNHSVKDFLEKDISKTKDFLSKTAKIISLTGGQISSEDLSSFIYNYEIYEQIENDENYDLKFAIFMKNIKDLTSQSDIDTIKWLFKINHKELLKYTLYGLDFDNISMLKDFFVYTDEDLYILDKFSQELETLLSLSQNENKNINLLIDLLENGKKIKDLNSNDFTELFLLYIAYEKFPFATIIEQINNSKELSKYISLLKKYDIFFDTKEQDEKGGVKNPVYRWQIALKFLHIEEDINSEIFEYLLTEDKNATLEQKKLYWKKYKLFESFPANSWIFKEYLFNEKYKKTYIKLFDSLASLGFRGIAAENDFLALRLLVDKNFNDILDKSQIHNSLSEEEKLVARYHSAIAVSRFIYDSVGNEIAGYDLSSDDIKKQIGVITELYVEALRQMGQIVLLDSHTKIYGLFNDETKDGEERFNKEAIQKMLEILGVVDKMDFQPTFYKVKDFSDARAAKGSWLDSIESLTLGREEERAYFVFRGHGDELNETNRLIVNAEKTEVITAQEMADALFNLATKEQDSVDLRRVTIDLSCCYSYFFARKVYDILEQKYKDYNEGYKDFKGTFPTIIVAAGLETETGLTTPSGQSENKEITQWIGNLHEGIIKVLKDKNISKSLTLDTLALSEYQFSSSNITMFASFDDNMTEKIEEIRETTQTVFEGYKVQTDKTEQFFPVQKGEEEQETAGMKSATGRMAVPPLTGGRFEASILKPLGLKLADYAHIWEELFFRTAPTAVSVII